LFFSATMPGEITKLADQMLTEPARVSVTPQATTVERIAQRVILTDKAAKPALLVDVLKTETTDRVLVFSRTKHGADKIVRHLQKFGYGAEAIHGNKSQNQRERVLSEFRNGRLRILVATDIAARGIDVDGVSHVVNYDLPNIPESYVHRIGRTARAGADGIAISFCDHEEMAYLRDIQRMIRLTIPSTDKRTGVRAESRPAEHHRPGGNGQTRNRGRQQQRGNGGGNNGGNGNGGNRHNGGNGHQHRPNRGAQAGNGQNGHAPRTEAAQGGEPAGIAAVPFLKRGNGPRRNNAGNRAPR
jgi:superfamily II DNA/RNA helicase